jgi:hypothetical protein
VSGNHPGIPSNTGTRQLSWDGLPASVRDQLERLLGHRVVAAASQPGGFSEGLAARARLADGSGVFIKAAQAATLTASSHWNHGRRSPDRPCCTATSTRSTCC